MSAEWRYPEIVRVFSLLHNLSETSHFRTLRKGRLDSEFVDIWSPTISLLSSV